MKSVAILLVIYLYVYVYVRGYVMHVHVFILITWYCPCNHSWWVALSGCMPIVLTIADLVCSMTIPSRLLYKHWLYSIFSFLPLIFRTYTPDNVKIRNVVMTFRDHLRPFMSMFGDWPAGYQFSQPERACNPDVYFNQHTVSQLHRRVTKYHGIVSSTIVWYIRTDILIGDW